LGVWLCVLRGCGSFDVGTHRQPRWPKQLAAQAGRRRAFL